jgi:hypothetical protein
VRGWADAPAPETGLVISSTGPKWIEDVYPGLHGLDDGPYINPASII